MCPDDVVMGPYQTYTNDGLCAPGKINSRSLPLHLHKQKEQHYHKQYSQPHQWNRTHSWQQINMERIDFFPQLKKCRIISEEKEVVKWPSSPISTSWTSSVPISTNLISIRTSSSWIIWIISWTGIIQGWIISKSITERAQGGPVQARQEFLASVPGSLPGLFP